jgi:hypothetical protein
MAKEQSTANQLEVNYLSLAGKRAKEEFAAQKEQGPPGGSVRVTLSLLNNLYEPSAISPL